MSVKYSEEKAKYRKSMVRPNVTYGIVLFYLLFTAIAGCMALSNDNASINNGFLTVYTGLSTLTASIVSFWFGNRSSSKSSGHDDKEGEPDKQNNSGEPENNEAG